MNMKELLLGIVVIAGLFSSAYERHRDNSFARAASSNLKLQKKAAPTPGAAGSPHLV